MAEQNPSNLPWFDRLKMSVPGYGGYDERGHRRKAAFALRDVLSHRLSEVRTQIDRARSSCERENLITEIRALDRVGNHLDRIIQRVGGLGTRVGNFYEKPDLDVAKLAPVYALDHAILEYVDNLAQRFESPDVSHNFLADIEAGLEELENKLDERAILLRKVN